jgi:hypothetical protein
MRSTVPADSERDRPISRWTGWRWWCGELAQRSHPASPVARASVVVSNRQDDDFSVCFLVDDIEGKASKNNASGSLQVRAPDSRKGTDAFENTLYLNYELAAQAGRFPFITRNDFQKLGFGIWKEDHRLHRSRSRALARTSAAGTPCTSPARYACKRRRISVSHACSTSASSSASASSRLASKRLARRARSPDGRARTSDSSCSIFLLMRAPMVWNGGNHGIGLRLRDQP